MGNREEDPVVLVVEDERELADLFAVWLEDDYDVRTAYTGKQALAQADPNVNAILLDRRLPDISGDEVLGRLRERGIDCRVAMVTAVEPDFDVLKLDIDEYITKPVGSDELRDIVDELLNRERLGTHLREYLALASKKDSLEREKSTDELRNHPEYDSLLGELTTVREGLTTDLIDQITYRNIIRLHRSARQMAFDLGLIGVLAIWLVTMHFMLPSTSEVLGWVSTSRTNVLSLYLSTFLHTSAEHLLGNAVAFLAIAILTYVLCLRMLATRWFYLTGVSLLVALPVVVGVLTYGTFELLGQQQDITFVGFSAVVAGFTGFSFLAFLVLLRTIYDPRSVLFASGFVLLLSTTLILRVHEYEVFLLAAATCLILFASFVFERYLAVTEGTEAWRTGGINVIAVAVIGGIYAGFGIGIVPAGTIDAYPGIVGHVIGFTSGFVIAVLTAAFLNLFPIRPRLHRKGLALSTRIL